MEEYQPAGEGNSFCKHVSTGRSEPGWGCGCPKKWLEDLVAQLAIRIVIQFVTSKSFAVRYWVKFFFENFIAYRRLEEVTSL